MLAQLAEQLPSLHPGGGDPQQGDETVQLAQVGVQRGARARVLDFHRDGAPVVPHGPVHLPDACGRGGYIVEFAELPAPVGAKLLR